MVTYPSKITDYNLLIGDEDAKIRLYGTKHDRLIKIGDIHFLKANSENRDNLTTFVNRGGFIDSTKPLTVLNTVVTLLDSNKEIFVTEKGELTTSNEVH